MINTKKIIRKLLEECYYAEYFGSIEDLQFYIVNIFNGRENRNIKNIDDITELIKNGFDYRNGRNPYQSELIYCNFCKIANDMYKTEKIIKKYIIPDLATYVYI